MSGTVAGVVLAAGESRRFGAAKQLAVLDGRTLLEHVLRRAVGAGLDPVVAVVPVWLSRPGDWSDRRLRWVRNPHPGRGMSHSLQLGFAALPAAAEAAVILLGDQPTMPDERIAAVLTARGERPIVASHVAGRPAPPVLVERSHFGLIGQAAGDVGLRDLLRTHPEWVMVVEMPDAVPDVDTRADLDRLGDR